ncbi:hypothetical protein DPMN_028942 [Dreissena polymorpha]|uniref:Uncharacterized protein n=1 Tax=Dreissena polymorpha TaxID=45954 RepID=A0A9D4LXN1_DREPO|nr:hypothetical protein DPMN_028942 [Dreissena polymorpha]
MAPNVLVVFEGTRRLNASARRVDTRRLRLVHITEWHFTSGSGLPGKYVSLTQSQANTTHRLTYTVTDSLISSRNGLPR